MENVLKIMRKFFYLMGKKSCENFVWKKNHVEIKSWNITWEKNKLFEKKKTQKKERKIRK